MPMSGVSDIYKTPGVRCKHVLRDVRRQLGLHAPSGRSASSGVAPHRIATGAHSGAVIARRTALRHSTSLHSPPPTADRAATSRIVRRRGERRVIRRVAGIYPKRPYKPPTRIAAFS